MNNRKIQWQWQWAGAVNCYCNWRLLLLFVNWSALGGSWVIADAQEIFPFSVGEKIIYSVEFGFVHAGEATMEVREIVEVDGMDCYHLVSEEETNPFFSMFFRIEDRFESYIDTTNLVTVRYEKHIREGKYKNDSVVRFDLDSLQAIYPNGHKVEIRPNARDIIATIYYLRTLDLQVGDTVFVENHTDGKNTLLEVAVLKREEVKTPLGKFQTILVQPDVKEAKVFGSRKGLKIWFTDDEWKIPVKIESELAFGSIQAVIKDLQFGD
ncbi:DUF3108 domain-containing protein [candidate division TA06 bacterium]|nr:DUF3108 domain-containing protein [candidate division TA06 bacterium]